MRGPSFSNTMTKIGHTLTALLAMAQRLGLKQIFSFDDHIDQIPYVTRVPKPVSAHPARRR